VLSRQLIAPYYPKGVLFCSELRNSEWDTFETISSPALNAEEALMWTFQNRQTKRTLRQSNSQLESLVLERTEALRILSQRLLRIQDQERRRVARDLHDSTGQILAALKISVALLQRRVEGDLRTFKELSGIANLADQALQEIRTTSFLLHPPLLDEVGFSSAAQWYVEGFAQRSGMMVRLDSKPEAERLPHCVEIALFRVLQESLTNVHRHSGASQVDICVRREAGAVVLKVRDYGRGIPTEFISHLGHSVRHSGVGLAGMRERLNELKGSLEIQAADPGTLLLATVPVLPQAASAHA
jgi:two-component system, NarL family, sensor kinase